MQPTPAQLPPSPTPTLESLTDQDRQRLSLLFRARGDPVSFAALREEDPLEILVWLCQPHIKPWHEAIKAAHRDHEQTETHLSLARALKDITRILDLEADSTLRIRAVNAIIKLANAIHRGSRHPNFRTGLDWAQAANRHRQSNGGPFPTPPNKAAELAKAAVRADNAAGDALLSLSFHAERRAHRDANLQDAKAPPAPPSSNASPGYETSYPRQPLLPPKPSAPSAPFLSVPSVPHVAYVPSPRPSTALSAPTPPEPARRAPHPTSAHDARAPTAADQIQIC